MSDPASALEIFLDELVRRVALLVAAGAVVIALTGAPGGPGVAVEDLITAAPSTQTSLDMLIDLVDRCAELDRSGR